ncbi:DUF481 domain-containing protein [Granulosicoccus antarcticus]|uniref:DUF481 domain-containing protein n=1 Tax=Granulosicoccus antarcticus IMCC3135 TaxID=1192854 RepID=A0A2Z2NZ80_9GAMM|nr:DUF481 domain-containing protein [Granulosicoccus antarcticus]ASJ76579.1 hypothetical protein IMCC3135_32670 [Granulosicoccus antarcticus IMCC3135]
MFMKSAISVAILSASSVASAIELTDFRDPNTSFDEAYVDFNANANSGNQDQTSYDAFLNAFYTQRTSTERKVWGFGVDGNADASRGPNSEDSSNSDFGFSAQVNSDVYFSDRNDKLFYFGEGSYAHQDSAIDDNIGVTVGLGYGRVWNATPLAKALRIQEALGVYGLLSKDMSDEDLLALAAIIGREDEYRSKGGADEYRGAWYADMEQAMAAAGVLPEGELSALGTVKLDDILFDEPISARRHGWLVRGGAGFQSSDFLGIADNDPKLLFQLEYAKPYGLRGQLLETATYEPVFGDNVVQKLSNRLSYSYEISDRVDWINSWDLSFQQADDDDKTRFMSNTLASTMAYHLTNRLDLGLTLAAVDTDDKPNLDRDNDEVATSAIINVRYRVK